LYKLKTNRTYSLLSFFIFIFLGTACNLQKETTDVSQLATPVSQSPTSTAVSSNTPIPTKTIASTETPLPTETFEPTETAIPTHTPIPTETAVSTDNIAEFTDYDTGFTLQYPNDWITFSRSDEDRILFSFASSQEFASGNDTGDSGALYGIFALPESSEPLPILLHELIEEYSKFRDITTVNEMVSIMLNEQEALQQTLVGDTYSGDSYTVSYTLVNAHQPFLILTYAPTKDVNSYSPIFNAMTESLHFSAPVLANTVTNSNFTAYTNSDLITFRYPQTWLIEEDFDHDSEIIIATNQEMLDGQVADTSGAALRITIEDATEYHYTPGDSLIATLDAIVADFFGDAAGMSVTPVTKEVEINGILAAITTFELKEERFSGYITFALIPYADFVALAFGVVSEGLEAEYAPILEQTIASITLPNSYVTYQSDTAPITFRHPANWVVDKFEDGVGLQSEMDLVANDAFATGAVHFLFWHESEILLSPIEQAQIFIEDFGAIDFLEAIQEPAALIINRQDAATATYTGMFLETPVVVRFTTFAHAGLAVTSIAITPDDNINTFIIPQDSIANSIRIFDEKVDFTDPVAVVQALFDAAATENFSALSQLCDPLDENDGDTEDICAITDDHPLRDEYVQLLSTGKVEGDPLIDIGFASVHFSFGPNNSRSETMRLVLRDGRWYLYSF